MPIRTKPNSSPFQPYGDFTWPQFAKDCLLNKYVLVVGSEVVLNYGVNPEARGDSSHLLFDLTLQQLAETSPDGDKDKEYERLRGLYHSFPDLLRNHGFDRVKVKEATLDAVRNTDFRPCFQEEFEPSLLELLATKCFRIVLTTTIDPYLEIAMEQVWGKGGFDVIQFENAQRSFKSSSFDEFGVIRPLLCYVFGKVNPRQTSSENRFVLSENDAMERISAWFENNKSNNFLKYIRDYRILSVGSQFDDWMFRFFWFLLRGKFNTEADGQVAVEVKDDDNLRRYLEEEKVKVFADARRFMQEAITMIKREADVDGLPRRDKGVFISYAHEDRYIALTLFERLCAAGLNVWLDEVLDGGDVYEKRIRNAIRSCKVFIPILSTLVRSDLESGVFQNRWYHKEWVWTQERLDNEAIREDGPAELRVIPIVVGDYHVGGSYHQLLPECMASVTAFDTSKKSIEELIRIINL